MPGSLHLLPQRSEAQTRGRRRGQRRSGDNGRLGQRVQSDHVWKTVKPGQAGGYDKSSTLGHLDSRLGRKGTQHVC